jgi:hypothetical protein
MMLMGQLYRIWQRDGVCRPCVCVGLNSHWAHRQGSDGQLIVMRITMVEDATNRYVGLRRDLGLNIFILSRGLRRRRPDRQSGHCLPWTLA